VERDAGAGGDGAYKERLGGEDTPCSVAVALQAEKGEVLDWAWRGPESVWGEERPGGDGGAQRSIEPNGRYAEEGKTCKYARIER
jgi:hypothetical protein